MKNSLKNELFGNIFSRGWMNQSSKEAPIHLVRIIPTKSVFSIKLLLGLGKRNGQYSFGLGEFILLVLISIRNLHRNQVNEENQPLI